MPNFDLKQRYNRNEFDNFIRGFLPDDYTRKETRVTPIGFQPQYATDITLIGVCKSLNLDVYEIHHSSVSDARVGIANDTFKLLQHNSLNNNALVAFIPNEGEGQWRFSLLQIELDAVEQSSRIKRSYSNPRRYSYVLGPDAHVRTPEKFLIDTGKIRERRVENKTLTPIEDLQSRFSVEVLSKEFYGNLFNWYLWATQHPSVSFPDREDADAGKDKSVKVIRLITRMLFVWFIKQKGLVPSSLFDVNEVKKVLKKLDPESNTSSTYYNAILQNLFFATLNRPVVEVDEDGVEEVREFAKNLHNEDAKNLYRYEEQFSISKEEIVKLFDPIPFLNASLFDCLDKSKTMNGVEQCFKYDGFSRNPRKQAHVPNELFFGKEQIIQLRVGDEDKERRVQGLINLFKQYNFTIEENSPREVEVSLDPELLGRVFENLLAAYNPETGESVRKSTGSFYTPREIVNYMVNESLVAYLKDKTKVSETDLRLLLSYDDGVPSLSNDQKQQLENAIKECKVLDPACGSGAFPMGMLQQMVHLWERVFPAASTGYTSRQTAMYERKLYLIEHCIFGVDIQPIAMLISKLRFFISLICEQPKADFDLKKRKENYGINTLPALETKFVAANTLIPAAVRSFDNEWTQDETLVKLKDDLLAIRHDNFVSQSYSKKRRLMKKSMEKCQEIHDYIMENSYKPNQQRIEMLETQIAKLEAEKLEYAGEHWVEEAVIGDLFGAGTEEPKKHDANLTKRKEIDKAIENCRQDIKKEQQKSAPQGFEKAVTELTAWDPYDQNTSSPFFDAEWMFGIEINRPDECNIRDGFDIVMGNPPYVDYRDIDKHTTIGTRHYSLYDKSEKPNLFLFFIEKGILLLKNEGVLTFINPLSMLATDSSYGLRKYLIRNGTIMWIENVSNLKVFKEASTYVTMWSFSKKAMKDYNIRINNCDNYDDFGKTSLLLNIEFVNRDEKLKIPINSNSFLIFKIENNKRKLFQVATSNWGTSKSGYGKLKINTLEYNRLDEKQKSKYCKIVQTADIKRYAIVWQQEYIPKAIYSQSIQKRFRLNKILIARVTKSIQATIDNNIHYYVGKATLLTEAKENQLFLLALLNSKLMSFWYYSKFEATHMNGGYLRYDIPYLEQMPIPQTLHNQSIINLVEKILETKEKDSYADTSKWDEEIDFWVYKLYGLTYDEVLIVDPKTTITREEYEKQ